MATRILASALVLATVAAQSAQAEVRHYTSPPGPGPSGIFPYSWEFWLDHENKIVTVDHWIEGNRSTPALDAVQFAPHVVPGYWEYVDPLGGLWSYIPLGAHPAARMMWALAYNTPDPHDTPMIVEVPEPTSLAISAAGIALALVTRRRSR